MPVNIEVKNVWINNINPIAKGCFICIKINLTINDNVIINIVISRNSL
jgi:hypothetical protein